VSRGAEHFSGDYEPGDGSHVTLTKAERERAEAAGVSVEEYGRQKLRMMKMKKAKIIRDDFARTAIVAVDAYERSA
jgi:hypothetical protein